MSTKHFDTYREASHAVAEAMEIRVKTADLRRETLDPQWVYLNRIGSKVRILTMADAIHNGGTIRNTIKITWNPDRYATDHVRQYVAYRLQAIQHFAQHGTCHQAIRCGDIRQVLCGFMDEQPGMRKGCWSTNNRALYTDPQVWAQRQAAHIA